MIPAKEFDGELWIRAADIHLLTKDKSHAWVGLTDEEVKNLCLSVGTEPIEVRLIEAKLREKNT
jgi:hypothetical protein